MVLLCSLSILVISQRSIIMIHRWSRWRIWCSRDLKTNKLTEIISIHQICPNRLTIRKSTWLPQLSTTLRCIHKTKFRRAPFNRRTNLVGTLNTNREQASTNTISVSTKSLSIRHSVSPRVKKADSRSRNQPLKRRLQIYTWVAIQIWMSRGPAVNLHLNSR